MTKKTTLTLIFLLFLLNNIFAQILTVTPENPTVDDSITLIYDATEGNGELAGYNGTIYMYTGVITANSQGNSDWKYIVGDWCENLPETQMTSLGNDLYQIEFNIKNFYDIPDDEIVLKIACLFTSEDCSLVGRDENNEDIFYNLSYNYSNTNFESYQYSNDSLFINCTDGQIVLTPYNTNVINIFSSEFSVQNDSSYLIVAEKTPTQTYLADNDSILNFSTDSVTVSIDTNDLNFKFIYDNDTILNAVKIYNFSEGGIIAFNLKENEKIYGTGSRAIEMDRHGHILSVNNQAHYGYGYGVKNLNITLPSFSSSEKYSILIDNYSIGTWDFGASDNSITSYAFANGQSDLYFIAGKNHSKISENIVYLSGYQPLPPLWSLGYIQSKYGYQTQTAAESIVNELINADFPLDAIVLDLYWFGSPATMGNLDWDYSQFPNPQDMMSNFETIGVKTINITEPYFTLACDNYDYADSQGYFAKDSATGNSFIFYGFWTGDASLIDIFNPQARDWFWDFYHNRTNEGVAGWWTDLGEPESHPNEIIHYGNRTANEIHNIYSLEWEKMVYQNWKNDFSGQRLFNLSRSGFIGMQRYSTFPWSGDIQRNFEGLKAQVPIMLSMGLGGIGYMHSDVGGFTGGGNNDELFTRWVQMGVFAPIFRIHGTGIETAPTAYGQQAQNITRNYIKLRYRLLPYNYTLAYENTVYGYPLVRQMDFYQPQNTELQNINDQYFWGDNFIIAPILESGQTQRDVILPEGDWIEWNSNILYEGNNTYTFSAPLENIPILIKAGSFIPTVRNLYSTQFYQADTLFVKYYPDVNTPQSSYTMFDDDKTTTSSIANSEYKLIHFNGNHSSNTTIINISSEGNGYSGMPLNREFVFEIFRIESKPASVLVDNIEIDEYATLKEILLVENGYFYSENDNILYIKTPFYYTPKEIEIDRTSVAIAETFNNVAIFPNPGNNYLNVQTSDFNDKKIEIYTIQGVLVKSVKSKNSNFEKIDTKNLKKGVYLVKIMDKNGSKTLKWIKK